MKTLKSVPKGGKPGPHGIYTRLFVKAQIKSRRWPDRWVQLRTYPGEQSAYEAKKNLIAGKSEVVGGVESWEIKAHRVPREKRDVLGYGSELLVKWIGGEG